MYYEGDTEHILLLSAFTFYKQALFQRLCQVVQPELCYDMLHFR